MPISRLRMLSSGPVWEFVLSYLSQTPSADLPLWVPGQGFSAGQSEWELSLMWGHPISALETHTGTWGPGCDPEKEDGPCMCAGKQWPWETCLHRTCMRGGIHVCMSVLSHLGMCSVCMHA